VLEFFRQVHLGGQDGVTIVIAGPANPALDRIIVAQAAGSADP
jgi:hypothetical protein